MVFLILTSQRLLKRIGKALRKPFGCWMATVHITMLLSSRFQSSWPIRSVKLLVTVFAFVEESYAPKMKPVLPLLAIRTFKTLNGGNWERCSRSVFCLVFVELSSVWNSAGWVSLQPFLLIKQLMLLGKAVHWSLELLLGVLVFKPFGLKIQTLWDVFRKIIT